MTIDVCPHKEKLVILRKGEKLTKGEREENWLLGMVERGRMKEEEENLIFRGLYGL